MGMSCISKPKTVKASHPHHEKSASSRQTPDKRSALQIDLALEDSQLTPQFPHYALPLRHYSSSRLPKSSLQIKTILQSSKFDQTDISQLPFRLYNHSTLDIKKYFHPIAKLQPKSFQLQQPYQDRLRLAILTSMQATLCSHSTIQVQDSPAVVNVVYSPPNSQLVPPLKGHHVAPLVWIRTQQGEIVLQKMTSFEDAAGLMSLKSSSKNLNAHSIVNNSVLNGVFWSNPFSFPSPNRQFISLAALFHEGSIGADSEFILYINPQLRDTNAINPPSFSPSTYLQLKAYLQGNKTFNIGQMFNSLFNSSDLQFSLYSVYCLVLGMKILMEIKKDSTIPGRVLETLFQLNQQQNNMTELRDCLNLLKILMLLSVNQVDVDSKCASLVRAVIVNSHILIDAYFHEFSLQIDEKQGLLRQQSLSQKYLFFNYRQLLQIKPRLSLVGRLKTLSETKLEQASSYVCNIIGKDSRIKKDGAAILRQLEEMEAIWIQQCCNIAGEQLGIDKSSIYESLKAEVSSEEPGLSSANEMLVLEHILSIKIVRLISVMGVFSKLFTHQECDFNSNGLIYEYWIPVFNQFMAGFHRYSSGELGLVISTLHGLIKSMDPQSSEEHDQLLVKAQEIWNRIYKDPLGKNVGKQPSEWPILIIKSILKSKSEQDGEKTIHERKYLSNLIACLNMDPNNLILENHSKTMQWVFKNLPIFNISGIFYNRIDLFIEEEKSSVWLRTGGSFVDSPCEQLSSKSNYSESHSSGANSLSKTRKKNRRKVHDSISQLEHRSKVYGVFRWGKGAKSVPLLHPLTRKVNVFRIACGNYHSIIATEEGILGWGENTSGQLGDGQKDVPAQKMKVVHKMQISSPDQIAISCGNEHTAVIIKKNRQLLMWGQQEGGLTAGKGHQFDQVACGGLHTLGILNGEVFSWGRGEGGQLGHKIQALSMAAKDECTDYFLDKPTKIGGLKNIKKCVCGDAHSVALSTSGQVFVFGFCYQGQLGLGLTGESECFQVFEPTKLTFEDKNGQNVVVSDIYAGSTFTFFKSNTGQIYSCGLNDCGQLGLQRIMKVFQKKKFISRSKNISESRLGEIEFSRPQRVAIFNQELQIEDIYCGQNHCLSKVKCMKTDKMVMGWGLNRSYQISSQSPSDSLGPRTIDSLQDFGFDEICCGSNFSLGLCRDPSLTQKQLTKFIEELVRKAIRVNP